MSVGARGEVKWETCWRQAAYLCKYIYSDPPGPDGFHTHYPEKMAEIEQLWEEWSDRDKQSESGLVARLFKLKNWDPADPEAPPCPPCLVFRGTDFEDMRGLAFAGSVRVRWGVVWWTFEFAKVFDPTMPAQIVTPARGRTPMRKRDYTRDDLLGMGFLPINILDESGTTTAEGATDGTRLNLNLTINADIMAKQGGDWYNNLLQGLGEGSEQYTQAFLYAEQEVQSKIVPLSDKRLQITGHSLGGGLASAVCCFLDNKFPDIAFHSMTFNASGVNPVTVSPASLSDAVARNFTVDDELLTTLQSYTANLPFVGAVFSHASRSLGMAAMPPALGTMHRFAGRSPGGSTGAKGSLLPNLFPVSRQTLDPAADSTIPVLSAIDGMLMSSPSVTQFGTRFAEWLNTRYRERANADNPWTIVGTYENMGALMLAEVEPELALLGDLFLHSAEYHGMDFVIATYEGAI